MVKQQHLPITQQESPFETQILEIRDNSDEVHIADQNGQK